MSWSKFASRTPHHPKILALSDGAFRIWFNSICHADEHKTDGVLSKNWIKMQGKPRKIQELFDAVLWEKTDDPEHPVRIHDFLEYNFSREEWQQLTEAKRRAGRAGGRKSAQARAQAGASAPASKRGEAEGKPFRSVPSEESYPGTQSKPPTSSISGGGEAEAPSPSRVLAAQGRAEHLKAKMMAEVQKTRRVPWVFPETEIRHIRGLLQNGLPTDAILAAWRAYVGAMQDPGKISVYYFTTNINRWVADAARSREE